MNHVDLFSGIGGFALAARWAGIKTVQFVEIDPFCQKVLQKNFKGVPIWDDIKTFTKDTMRVRSHIQGNITNEMPIMQDVSDGISDISEVVTNAKCNRFNGQTVPIQSGESQQKSSVPSWCNQRPFLLTGGFPCQPFSCAGKRKGTSDDRHLWPHMLRVIKEFNPRWVIAENVRGLTNIKNVVEQGGDAGMEDDSDNGGEDGISTSTLVCILDDLEQAGYSVQVFLIPACGVGACHKRDRLWIIARNAQDAIGGRNGWRDNGDQAGMQCSLQAERSDCNVAYAEKPECEQSGRTWARRERFADSDRLITNTRNQRLQGGQWPPSHGERQTAYKSASQCDNVWDEPWIEAAQRFCKLDARLPSRLAGCLTYPETYGIIGFISFLREYHYGKINEDWRTEVLPILQHAFNTEQVSELFGRFHPFFTEEILRCPVHGTSHDERYGDKIGVSLQGEKTQRKQVREVRIDNDSFNSPHRRGYTEQCSCEFDDIVCELSSEIALGEWKRNSEKAENILFNLWKESRGERFLHEPLSALYEIWRSVTDKEIGSFRRHYHKRDEHRVQKLKALGNAIVPQVAYEIMKNIVEVEVTK